MAALPLAALVLGLVSVLVGHGDIRHVPDHQIPAGVAAPPVHPTPGRPAVSPQGVVALPAPAAEVTARLRRLLARRPGIAVSLAGLDLTDGSRYRYLTNPVIHTASVVKLDILEAWLLRHQHSGQPLDDAETANASAMIEHNDNDAADTLWDKIGSAGGLRTANRQLGTTHTSPDIDRYWARSTSDADDQLTLLHNLLREHPLSADSRTYALDLLSKVDTDQSWGVSAAADPGSTPAFKNGSLNIDDDNGLWATGSVGIITVRGHQVMLAVLTQHNPTQQAGIDLVQELVTTSIAALAHVPPPTGR